MIRRRLVLGGLVLAFVAWLASGVVTIAPGERGVTLRYGRVARVLSPGMSLTLPWPIEEVRRVDVELSRRMPVGYRLIDSERQLDPKPSEVQWLTGDTNIVELRANVLYRVVDPVAWLFGVSDAGADSSLGDEGHRSFALRRLGERVLTEHIASLSVQEVLARDASFQTTIRTRLQAEVDQLGLGVRVSSVEVVESAPPLMVISSFNRVRDASQEAQQAREAADGERRAQRQQARAEAAARLGRAQEYAAEQLAAARAFVSQLDALAPEDGIALTEEALTSLWYDTIGRIFSRLEIVILPAGVDGEAPIYYRPRRK